MRYRVRLLDALRRSEELDLAQAEARQWAVEGGGETARSLAALLHAGAGDSAWTAACDSAIARGD